MQVTVYQKKKLRKSSYPSPPILLTDEQLPYSTKHVKIWLFSVVVKCLSPLNNFCNFSKNFDFQVCLLGIFVITTTIHVPTLLENQLLCCYWKVGFYSIWQSNCISLFKLSFNLTSTSQRFTVDNFWRQNPASL